MHRWFSKACLAVLALFCITVAHAAKSPEGEALNWDTGELVVDGEGEYPFKIVFGPGDEMIIDNAHLLVKKSSVPTIMRDYNITIVHNVGNTSYSQPLTVPSQLGPGDKPKLMLEVKRLRDNQGNTHLLFLLKSLQGPSLHHAVVEPKEGSPANVFQAKQQFLNASKVMQLPSWVEPLRTEFGSSYSPKDSELRLFFVSPDRSTLAGLKVPIAADGDFGPSAGWNEKLYNEIQVPLLTKARSPDWSHRDMRVDVNKGMIWIPDHGQWTQVPLFLATKPSNKDIYLGVAPSVTGAEYETGPDRILELVNKGKKKPQVSGSIDSAIKTLFHPATKIPPGVSVLGAKSTKVLQISISDMELDHLPGLRQELVGRVAKLVDSNSRIRKNALTAYLRLTPSYDGSSAKIGKISATLEALAAQQPADQLFLLLDTVGMSGIETDGQYKHLNDLIGGLSKRFSELKVVVLTSQFSSLDKLNLANVQRVGLSDHLSTKTRIEALQNALKDSGMPILAKQLTAVIDSIQAKRAKSAELIPNPTEDLERTMILLLDASTRFQKKDFKSIPAEKIAEAYLHSALSRLSTPTDAVQRARGVPEHFTAGANDKIKPLNGMGELLEHIARRDVTFLNYGSKNRPTQFSIFMGPPGTGKNRVAEDIAKIVNNEYSEAAYEVVNLNVHVDEAGMGNFETVIQTKLKALRLSKNPVKVLILDEAHLQPLLLQKMLAAVGDSDRAIGNRLFNFDGIQVRVLMNVDQGSPAYSRLLKVSLDSPEYAALAKQLFVETITPKGSKMSEFVSPQAIEALASRLAPDILFFKPPSTEAKNDLDSFATDVIRTFEERHKIKIWTTDTAYDRLRDISVRYSGGGWRAAEKATTQEIEHAFSDFVETHPGHKYDGYYQLTYVQDGGHRRLMLTEADDFAPVIESREYYKGLRQILTRSYGQHLQRKQRQLKLTASKSDRDFLDDQLRASRGLKSALERSGEAELFNFSSGAEIVPAKHPMQFPKSLNKLQTQEIFNQIQEPMENLLIKLRSGALDPNKPDPVSEAEAIEALESIHRMLNDVYQEFGGKSDPAFKKWIQELSPGTSLENDALGIVAGYVTDDLLRKTVKSHFLARQREVATKREQNYKLAVGSGGAAAGPCDKIGEKVNARAQNLREVLQRLRLKE